ncbi:hypothetical protein BD626DRAFT_565060 [Schizophyllum amplum]|uniref:INO80 complex subunit F domain-containing protein n=1 Tax=Schizophyllum amplum TaxID=97359 RepID=A0A550CTU5_9AGAR|nr:hypothetical protein BD626DRAFT_565060 [Auriculariopsis ampla]
MSRQPTPAPRDSESAAPDAHFGQQSTEIPADVTAPVTETNYITKYKDLKRKVEDIETENDKLYLKVLHAKRNIQRMKLERAVLYERLTTIPPSPELRDRSLPVPPPVLPSEPAAPMPPHRASPPHTIPAPNGESYRTRPAAVVSPEVGRLPPIQKTTSGPGDRPLVAMDRVIPPPEISPAHSMSASHSTRPEAFTHIPPPPLDARRVHRAPPEAPEPPYDARHSRVPPSAPMPYSPHSSHPSAYSHGPPDAHYGHVPPAHSSRTRSVSHSRPVAPTPPHTLASGYPPHPTHHSEAIPGPSMRSPPHLDRRRMHPHDPHEHPIPHDTHNSHRPRSPRARMSPVDSRSPYAVHDRHRAGPGSYADNTRPDREWENDWGRDRGEYPPRRARDGDPSIVYGPPPPALSRSRQVTANGDYVDHRVPPPRDEPAYFPPVPAPDYGSSAVSPGPVSGPSSAPSEGPHRVAQYSRPREAEQAASYRLRPVAPETDYDERWSHPSRDRAPHGGRSAYSYPDTHRSARGPPPGYSPSHPPQPPPPLPPPSAHVAPRKRPREDLDMADADDRRPPPPRMSYPGHAPHDPGYPYYQETHQSRPPPSSHHYHHRHYRHDEDTRGP